MYSFRTRRRVEFADTDMGGIVHFSRFFAFMEAAEHELLRSLGLEVHSEWQGHVIGWPRLSASCQYLSPVRFGQELEILVEVERKGTKSVTYRFTLSCGEVEVARGRLISVCCILDGPAGLESIPIPPFIADRLEEAPGKGGGEGGPGRS